MLACLKVENVYFSQVLVHIQKFRSPFTNVPLFIQSVPPPPVSFHYEYLRLSYMNKWIDSMYRSGVFGFKSYCALVKPINLNPSLRKHLWEDHNVNGQHFENKLLKLHTLPLNGHWSVTDPQSPPTRDPSAVDTCRSVMVTMNNMLSIFIVCYVFLFHSTLYSNFFWSWSQKNHAKSVLFIVLIAKQLFLNVTWCRLFTCIFYRIRKESLSSWVELQYGILFSLIYAIPCFGFIF